MRVLVGDDHAILRKGIKQILAEIPSISTVDEATNGQEVLALTARKLYDLVLLDISMPGRSGLDVLKQLRADRPRLPVLILSMHPEEQYALRALKAGASGYLTKESAPDELIAAVQKILEGGKYVSQSLAERFITELSKPSDKPLHELLSDREYQIFCMIASGKTVSEIAEELALSVKTVSTYRTRILQKTNLKTNAEITRYVIENKLI
jgi:two-component system, NarL family, invasion response regulator UvrY